VPRGGGSGEKNANTEENQGVAKNFYYQQLSEQLKSDIDDDTSEEELLFDSEDDNNYDVEASSENERDDTTEEPLDPILDPLGTEAESIIPKFLSPHHLTTTLPSNLIHFANMVIQAARRSLVAGARAILVENVDEKTDTDVDSEEEESYRRPVVRTFIGKTVFVLGEMYHAVKSPSLDDVEIVEKNDGGNRKHRRRRRKTVAAGSPSRRQKRIRYTTSPTEVVCNGGGMEPHSSNKNALLNLARQYNINLPTENDIALPKQYDSILLNSETPLSAALQKSNSDARFLICYISKKKKGTNNKSDFVAISSLLSPEVVKLFNRRPLGKKQSDNTGSYYVWIMNGDDGAQTKEIDVAMKRLKVKPPTSNSKNSGKKKEDGPILAIFYPATTVDSSGKLKVTPRLLAQHHCHPPPTSAEVMMNWANTIRKRHVREFAKLQHDRKEMQLLKERTEGYKESMKEDKAREEREERELQAKKEEEEKERLRKEKLERRRQELLEALPEEPDAGSEGVITIALRFGDGSRDQRRFVAEDTSLNDVFNWVDATHGLEREKIELSTMNGSKTFSYVEADSDDDEESGNVTLDEAGLGKMTALRVTEIVEELDEKDDEEGDEYETSDQQ
jgi:hypothetical protein